MLNLQYENFHYGSALIPAGLSAEQPVIFPMSTEIKGGVHKMEHSSGWNRMLVRKGGY
jgi:hypothetical protein